MSDRMSVEEAAAALRVAFGYASGDREIRFAPVNAVFIGKSKVDSVEVFEDGEDMVEFIFTSLPAVSS